MGMRSEKAFESRGCEEVEVVPKEGSTGGREAGRKNVRSAKPEKPEKRKA